MEKILVTRAGITALEEELKSLKSVDRPAVIGVRLQRRASTAT